MRSLRALDLFCGGGGASVGLYRAGFDVTGVDINPQPHYPFQFVQADALASVVDPRGFDFVWASPLCQAFTSLRHLQKGKVYPNLIPATRELLREAGVPYVIENVEGAPLGEGRSLVYLCGSMFGLTTRDGRAELRRHRIFETSFAIPLQPSCQHSRESLSVTGRGLDSNRDRYLKRRTISITGSTPQSNVVRNQVRKTYSIADARFAMGIDWLPLRSLSQAVPPAYSEFIAREFLAGRERIAA